MGGRLAPAAALFRLARLGRHEQGGALLAVGVDLVSAPGAGWARLFGFIAVVLAAVNIFGGFLVTRRMLAMFQGKKKG